MLCSLAFAGTYPAVAVEYNALSAATYRVASSPGDVACAATASSDWSYQNAKLVQIRAGEPIFGGASGGIIAGGVSLDTIYFDPVGLTNNGASLNGIYSQATNTALWKPRILWKLAGRGCYNWNYVTTANYFVAINAAGAPLAAPNSAGLTFTGITPPMQGNGAIYLNEYADTLGMVNSGVSYVANTPSSPTILLQPNAVYYWSATYPSTRYYEPPFTTERGTVWNSIAQTKASLSIAKQMATPTFVLTQPGSGSQYSFATYITDTVDRTPGNRRYNNSEDGYSASLSSADTGGAVTSPLRAVLENSATATRMYSIGAGKFPNFGDYAIADSQAMSTNYVEKQSFWVGSTPNAVAYDSSMAVRDVDVNKLDAIAYSVKFDGNDWGIPVCTGDMNVSDDYTSCAATSNSRTDSHRVTVKFLGSDWVISQLQQPTAQLASSVSAINGGQVKLAKELNYGIIGGGQTLSSSPFSIRLTDVSPAGNHPAILDIMKNGQDIGQISVAPGVTYAFTQAGGQTAKVHVYRTGIGTTLNAKWAELATYSDEITLKDNARYNLVSSTDPNQNYFVSLLWKNRGYTGAITSAQPDSLREIVIYNTDDFVTGKMKKGDSVGILAGSPAYSLKYEGITAQVVPITGGDNGGNNTTGCEGYTNLSIGQTLAYGNYRVRLQDVSAPTGVANAKYAIVSVLDSNDVVVAQQQIASGNSYVYATGGSQNLAISVCQADYSPSLASIWATIKLSSTNQPGTANQCIGIGGSGKYGIANVGQALSMGAYMVRVRDISVPTGSQATRNAIVDILDSNEVVVGQAMITPGATYVQASSSPGTQNLAVSICQTALGVNMSAKWVELKIYWTNQSSNNPCPRPIGVSKYGTINVGQTLDAGAFKMKLDGLAYSDPQNLHPANVSVLNANDAPVANGIQIAPGQSYTYNGTGGRLKIDVCQTALGATRNAMWATMSGTVTPTDTTPPNVSVSVAQYNGQSNVYTITATATDASGIFDITVYVAQGSQNGHGAFFAKSCSSSPCSYTTGSNNGQYVYYATATDASAGKNVGQTQMQTFSLPFSSTIAQPPNASNTTQPNDTKPTGDTTPPAVSASVAQYGTQTNVYTITASASDASGISEIRIYDASGSSASPMLAKTCTSSPCSFTTGNSNGLRTFYAEAKDASPNKNTGYSGAKTFSLPFSSAPGKTAANIASVANSMADTTGNIYAKMMNVLGVYVQGYQ